MYGYPDGPINDQKYVLGGCCVSDNDPTRKCIECGWEGEYVNNMGSEKEFLKAVKLPDISKMTDEELDLIEQIYNDLDEEEAQTFVSVVEAGELDSFLEELNKALEE